MRILICGLGLMGGSLARALKYYTYHYVYGYDVDINSAKEAVSAGACDDGGDTLPPLGGYDIIILAAYPRAAVDFINTHAPEIPKSAYLFDLGGVKRTVCDAGFAAAEKYGFTFIGGHPMTGTQYSGFTASRETLYNNASMILVPPSDITAARLDFAVEFFKAVGCASVSVTTAREHDEIIAFTSQLAHVLSNAYVKSPTSRRHRGYSAGSFRDLTRVAHLNARMWSELFMDNRDMLIPEIEQLAGNLLEYSEALKSGDAERLETLLADGSRINDEIKS